MSRFHVNFIYIRYVEVDLYMSLWHSYSECEIVVQEWEFTHSIKWFTPKCFVSFFLISSFCTQIHHFIYLHLKKSTFNGIWFSINSKLNIFQKKINIVMLAHALCIHWPDSNLSQNFKSRLYIEWMCLLSNKMLTMVMSRVIWFIWDLIMWRWEDMK